MVRHTLLVSQTGRGKFAPPATIRDPLCTPTNGPATPISSGRSGSDCQSSVMPDSSAGLASSAYPQLANREQAAASKRTSNLDGAKRLMFNGLTSIHQNKMSVTGLSFAYLTRFLWQLQLVIPARTSSAVISFVHRRVYWFIAIKQRAVPTAERPRCRLGVRLRMLHPVVRFPLTGP